MKWILSTGMIMLLSVTGSLSLAQVVDTIMQLDTVSISTERYAAFSAGQKKLTLGPNLMQHDDRMHIGNLLSENSSVYIRSYGQSSITSMSVRGTSSSQSAIFWNGINIRMPSLGTTDLSLIPSTFFDDASLVYGGSSIRYGSGAIGGALFLENKPDFSGYNEGRANLWGGSYGELGASALAVFSRKKWYFKFSVLGQQARNNFEYSDSRGEHKPLENAAVNALGLNSHAALMLSKRSRMDFLLWYQEALREVPPTSSMERSEAYQSDRALRTSVQWKSILQKGVINVKTAWFKEYENYTDPLISLQSEIETSTWYAEAEYTHNFSDHLALEGGASLNAEMAEVDAYLEPKDRQLYAMFINIRQHIRKLKWDVVAGARQELGKKVKAPFSPSLGMEGPIYRGLGMKANVSRNYRLPTLNELYWHPGGNPDIKPEQSWNTEASLLGEFWKNAPGRSLKFSASIFSSLVDDWILWTPEGSLWHADNVQKVWARGLELDAGFKKGNAGRWGEISVSYTWTRSTNESASSGQELKGKQIIYTPVHRASAKAGITCFGWELRLYGNYTGQTFTTTDNSSSLPGYFLADLSAGKTFVAGQGSGKYPPGRLTIQSGWHLPG